MIYPIKVGTVVISKAGRDKGRYFIVTDVIDGDFVSISDGKLRKIENPKKKKIKHLIITDKVSNLIVKKIDNDISITNKLIKDELKRIQEGGL